MDILEIPFNRLLGIKKSPGDGAHLLELDDLAVYQNHLGTVHAAAQLALAEASSAEYLRRTFQGVVAIDDVVVVVRRIQAKFKNLLKGKVYSKAHSAPEDIAKFSTVFAAKGMGLLSVSVDIVDDNEIVGMSSLTEWFVQRPKKA